MCKRHRSEPPVSLDRLASELDQDYSVTVKSRRVAVAELGKRSINTARGAALNGRSTP
jgi:hypothetical protein